MEEFTSFSTSFFFNSTNRSIKCNSLEEWAENWINVGDQWNSPKVPCSINDALHTVQKLIVISNKFPRTFDSIFLSYVIDAC